MSRTLTGAAQTETDKLSGVKPINVLKIIRDPDDDLYLSDAVRTLEEGLNTDAAVLNWGQVDQRGSRLGSQQDAAALPLANYSIKLSLADATLRSIFLSKDPPGPPIGAQCILYQFWQGLEWGADEVTIYDGTLGSIARGRAQQFDEREVTVTLNIIDRFKTLLDKEVGNVADVATFASVLQSDEGRVLPLVYGRAKKVKAVMVDGPKIAALMKNIDKDAETFYAEGLDQFPDGAITIRMGHEYIEGSRSGNTFTVTARGAAVAEFTSGGSDPDYRFLFLSDGTGIDDQYVGLWAGVQIGNTWRPGDLAFQSSNPDPNQIIVGNAPPATNAWDGRQWRQIHGYDASTKKLELNAPYTREGLREQMPSGGLRAWGHQTYVPSGANVKIGTIPAPHGVGDMVYEVKSEYKFILNNAVSSAVNGLYFHGHKGEWKSITDYADGMIDVGGGSTGIIPAGSFIPLPSMSVGVLTQAGGAWADMFGSIFSDDQEADFQAIPESFYVTSKNDNTWNSELGHNVTTITMKLLPSQVPFWRPEGMTLWADISGITDDDTPTGTLITNPSDIIKDVLKNRIGDIVDGDIDSTSFSATKSSLASWLEWRGVIERVMRGGQLVAWLALQCRSRIRFEAGQIYLSYLTNAMGANVSPAIDKDNALLDTVRLSWDSPGEVINELTYSFRGPDDEKKTGLIKDAASISAYGRKAGSINLKFVAAQDQAEQVAYHWLYRWSRNWQRGQVRGFLPLLPFQRDDAITVDFPAWELESVPADVTDIRHRPGAAGSQPDNITADLRFPVYHGCTGTCEAFCETGSESIAVTVCTSTCETAAQTLCALLCQTRNENMEGCGTNCQVGNQVLTVDPPEDGDWIDSTGGPMGPCITVGCQSCQGDCVTDCQTFSNDCSTSCISQGGSCETTCEAQCTVAVETGICTESCEAPGEVGVFPCDNECEGNCQISDGCNSGCETDCQTGTTTCACDEACEPGGACEASCETGQTVDPSCDLACEPSGMATCDLSDTTFAGY